MGTDSQKRESARSFTISRPVRAVRQHDLALALGVRIGRIVRLRRRGRHLRYPRRARPSDP